MSKGGNFSKMLENLIFSDLVEKMVSYGEEKNEFGIDGRYVGDLENKVAVYKDSRPSQAKAVHLTMVTTFGLKPSKHNTIVQSQVTLDDLFEKR